MHRLVVDLSKSKDHPDHQRYVDLTPEEIAARQAEGRKAAEKRAVRAEREEMANLREKLLDAQAAGETADSAMRDRFRELKAKHGE